MTVIKWCYGHGNGNINISGKLKSIIHNYEAEHKVMKINNNITHSIHGSSENWKNGY